MYAIFVLKPLHNLHLAISKLIKIRTFYQLGSESLSTTVGYRMNKSRTFRSMRKSALRGGNSILAAIERDSYTPRLHVNFSHGERGSNLNGIFTQDGVRGMLEKKDYQMLDVCSRIP